jgi:RNA polymerase sigma-70 factor (ECF subfamily)
MTSRDEERMTDQLDRLYERLLVLRCQTGDEAAFAEIVQRYQPRLRKYLRSMLGDAHLAEDALQEVWLDVFRGVGKLRDTAAFAGWIYRVARDRAYRVLRRKHVVIEPIEAADVPDAGEVELDADEREKVKTSMDRLPHEQREVLLLRFVEQMSYDDIAQAVGCELGTVRSRLHYAKRALRALIERNGHEQHG